jgi:3-hydroxyisobutyrate dehydrogenase-like beta-hydroxyacid dehydrogenase
MKIAFIGLGNMGAPMALNIAKAQYSMLVNDLDKEKSAHLLKAGAVWANSAIEAVKGVDIVMTSLPGPKQVEELAIGENNILDNMKNGTIWIDLSTNNLDVMQKMQKQADARNIRIMDAPVSGGTEGAANGSLSIYVGGAAKDYDEVKDLLNVIGNDVRHLGENGAGYIAKIAQVILCYLHSVALSEALMLGVKGGGECLRYA